ERPRTDAHEGDAVAMARIHVRLDLENEARERRRRRFDHDTALAVVRQVRRRPRTHFDETVEEHLHAEIRYRAAEKDRRRLSPEHGVAVERAPGALQEIDLIDRFPVRR